VANDDVDLDDIASAEVERLRRKTSLDVRSDITPARLTGTPMRCPGCWQPAGQRGAARGVARRGDVRPRAASSRSGLATTGGHPEVDRSRVFDRFVRLDPTAHATRAVPASASRSCGRSWWRTGHVSIGDRVGGGTVVRLQLPLAADPDSSL